MRIKKNQLNSHHLNLHLFDRCVVLVVSFLIMMVLIMFNVYINRTQKSQLELIQMVMKQNSENLEAQYEAYIDEKVGVLQTLTTYPDIYEMDEAKQAVFINKRSEKLGFRHLFIVNAEGIGFYVDEGVHRVQKKEKFYADIMGNDIFVTEPFYTEDGTIITVSVSIYNEQNEKVGALCGAVNLDDSQQLIKQNAMVLKGGCFIVDAEGRCMTDVNFLDLSEDVSLYTLPDSDLRLLDKVFSEKQNQVGAITLNGIEYQVNLTHLKRYNWVLVQSVPTTEIVVRYKFMNELHAILIVLIAALMLCVARIAYCWKQSDKKIYTDALTKCNSRAACQRVIERLENCKDSEITIMYMDLNKFKYVNDTYGHDKGDQLLCIFGEALMKIFGVAGFVGRMGGDEFVSIMVDVDEAKIIELWGALESELLERSKELDFDYVITSSYGYFVRGKNEDISLEHVMRKADMKMYEYKVAKVK